MQPRVAFLFPGQGSHRPGMATAWRTHPAFRAFGDVARATGLDLEHLADDADACGFSTSVGQPAIFAASWAAHEALTAAGIVPDVVAGHSLGEVTAAAASGALRWPDAAALVGERARAMGEACAATPGAMAAVVKLERSTIEAIVGAFEGVAIANQNADGQVVISGGVEELDGAMAAIRDAGGRAISLRVEGAFHSPAMAPAVVSVDDALARMAVASPTVPFVTGLSGALVRTADDVHRALVDGILAPVQWVDVQHRLRSLGVKVVVEIGPGGVLAALARRAHPDLTVLTCAAPADAEQVAERLQPVHA